MACFFVTRTVFLSRAWEARLTPSDPPCSEKSTPLLHMSKILTGAIDAYFCRGNGLVSKRQTDTVGESPSRFEKYFFLRKFSTLFCLPRRQVGYTNFSTFEFANSIGKPFWQSTRMEAPLHHGSCY
jgi:hypothetical protein